MRFSTNPIAMPRAFAVASVALFLVIAATGSGPAAAQSGSFAGVYDGGQMEIAAALELKPDGRFNYALSYGALDEEAAGRWTASGDRVLLSSNPVVAPRLFLVSRARGPEGMLQLSLDVPKGVSRQYFDAMVTRGNGRTQKVQLSEEGLSLPFGRADPPTAVRLALQIFRVASEPVGTRSEFRLRRPVPLRAKRHRQSRLLGRIFADCQRRSLARPARPNAPIQTHATVRPPRRRPTNAAERASSWPELAQFGRPVLRARR